MASDDEEHTDAPRLTIVVSGVTGQVGESVATHLSAHHDVIGIARFSDNRARERLEAAGVTCVAADMASADFDDVPSGVDAVLNFAVVKSQRWDLDLRANADGAGLLMAHTAPRTFLHCSSTGVYAPAGAKVLDESAPLGDNHRPIMATYSISKIAAEAVVRTMARQLHVPTVIARLNVPYGVGPDGQPRGWPAFQLAMMQEGMEIPVAAQDPNLFNPIDLRDMAQSIPSLLGAASVPATVVNWAGSEQVSLREWCTWLAELTSVEARFVETDQTIGGVTVDTSRFEQLYGPTKVPWRQGFADLAAAHLAARS